MSDDPIEVLRHVDALLQHLEDDPPTCFKCHSPIAFDDIRIITVRQDGEPMSVYCCRQHARPDDTPNP